MGRTQLETIDLAPDDGSDYTGIEIPEPLARRTRTLFGLDEPPETLGELSALFESSDTFATGDRFTWEDLLVSEGGTRHEVRVGGDVYHTYCVLDALVLPFVLEQRVEIRSQPPGSEEVIEIVATPDLLKATPASTVVSFGVSRALAETTEDMEALDDAALLELTHAKGCPRINAFPDHEAYETWDQTAEAVTVVLTLAQAYAMAHDTAEVL